MEHIDQIKKLSEKGVDENDDDIFGLHGTSIEAIKYLAKYGTMPTTGDTKYHFHFCPKAETSYWNGPYERAREYARINAVRNALIAILEENGLQLNRSIIDEILDFGEEGNLPGGLLISDSGKELCKKIMSCLDIKYEYRFDKFYRELQNNNRGLVLGISPKIKSIAVPGPHRGDLMVVVPQGLPLDYISGIEPEGQLEWNEIFDNDLKNVRLLY